MMSRNTRGKLVVLTLNTSSLIPLFILAEILFGYPGEYGFLIIAGIIGVFVLIMQGIIYANDNLTK